MPTVSPSSQEGFPVIFCLIASSIPKTSSAFLGLKLSNSMSSSIARSRGIASSVVAFGDWSSLRDVEGIDKKESDLRNRLDMIQGELMQNPNDTSLQVAEKDILHQYMKVKQATYSFLQQKAKVLWLKDGDSNSKLFHQSIKHRQYRNRVPRIIDENGTSFLMKV
ncbi:hypothetical protein RIF29_28992 [Crotalaria pallida]|uniref:Uncharacterized protein n=1 Tax=Crotalaria pallida TaxID=3830 RepID=A0AAN9HVU5_CROPI